MNIVEQVDAAFREFIGDERFPCLAGKGTVRRGSYHLRVYDILGSVNAAHRLAHDLAVFAASIPADPTVLSTFVAVFTESQPADEIAFERQLWEHLQRVHECDDSGAGWDSTVSSDPDDPHFSFSVAGRAFFIVGLHPGSSRVARRFAWPALVFNPRAQFDRLRADGRFEPLRTAVREREVAIQGTLNPNLADFGEASEARQYSGRATEAEWRCPFHARGP